MPHVSHFSFISESQLTKYNKASVNFSDVLTASWTLFVSFLLLPIHLCFVVVYWRRDEKIQMPSLKPSESKKGSQRKEFSILCPNPLLFISPSTLEACVTVCMRVDGWVHVRPRLFKGLPLHVIGAGKCRGPHQRAVLTLPAWKLFSDKRPGPSKGGSSEGMTAGDSSLDEGWGHPPGSGGLVTDRQAWGRARGWGSVRWPFKCQRHELFPWQALPLLCQMSNTHGAWSYKICCLLSQIIWTFWHGVNSHFVLCFHASKFWILDGTVCSG